MCLENQQYTVDGDDGEEDGDDGEEDGDDEMTMVRVQRTKRRLMSLNGHRA